MALTPINISCQIAGLGGLRTRTVHDDPHHARVRVLVRELRDQRAADLLPWRHPEGLGHLLAWKVHPHRVCKQGE